MLLGAYSAGVIKWRSIVMRSRRCAIECDCRKTMVKAVLIGREGEQLRLRQFFDQALAVGGQLAFVTGEAGSGKTTLVQAFVAQMQATHANLVVALGDCNTQ